MRWRDPTPPSTRSVAWSRQPPDFPYTRQQQPRSPPTHVLSGSLHNLPVVAGDCLLVLPITLRRSAFMHADLNPASAKPAGMLFSIIVKRSLSLNILGVN